MDSEEALIVAITSMAETIERKDNELSKLEDINRELRYEVARLKTQLATTNTPLGGCPPEPILTSKD